MLNSKHLIWAGLGMAILLGLGVATVIWPNYRQAATTRKHVAELRQKIGSIEIQNREVQRLDSDVTKLRSRVANELKLIPEAPASAALIGKLSQPVDNITVMDQQIMTGSPSEAIIGGKTSVQAMPLTVDMEATFDSIFALIQNAESIGRLVRVSSVRILCKRDEKSATANDPPIVKATVVLEAIYDPPGAAGEVR